MKVDVGNKRDILYVSMLSGIIQCCLNRVHPNGAKCKGNDRTEGKFSFEYTLDDL